MRIYILTDNTAGGDYLAEHGLSYLIEIDDQKILFDTGHSDIFLRNAVKMGINIEETVETIVLSHGHWDHGNGLKYLKNKKLIAHPAAFMRRFRKKDFSPIGLALSESELKSGYDIIKTRTPLKITEHLYFLGEIPRKNDFEAKSTTFVDDFRNDDFIPDDSAIVAIIKEELIIITGCSHSGICNIIQYAKKITGISKVHAVLGGFHLKDIDKQTLKTIEYIKKEGITKIYPSHCTELPALSAFYAEFKSPQLKTGKILDF